MNKKRLFTAAILAIALWVSIIIAFSILNSILGLEPGDQKFISGMKVLISTLA